MVKPEKGSTQAFILLNRAHAKEINEDEELKALFHLSDHDPKLTDVNLARGELILPPKRVVDFFDNATTLSRKHIRLLFIVNQQFANIFGQLKNAYDLLYPNPKPPDTVYLKRIYEKSEPLFNALYGIQASVFGYYEVAFEAADKANETVLLASLEHEHTEFQRNFEQFETYMKETRFALGIPEPPKAPPEE
jgi:hypothetical protein